MSSTLVRLEQKGPRGFEDRPTFTVINRKITPVEVIGVGDNGAISYVSDNLRVDLPDNAESLDQVTVRDRASNVLYKFDGHIPKNHALPAPGQMPKVWVMSDSPRLVPPAWGATPAPIDVDPELAATSGWDSRNNAPDIYVFVPGKGGYLQLRKDFLALTGPIPKTPLFALGFIDSRWYPYTEEEALSSIDTYRKLGIPLDTFVVDTDWRINGSAGYDVETKDFPDMPRFIKEAHGRNVHLMFNDHPDPKAPSATDPKELAFRWAGLSKLFNWGLDIWWYDRNWSTSLREPMPGIRKEVWGQRLYHDMTEKARPTQRPWIMSNAQGIDNGNADYDADPAGHRYPMWWTGDTGSRFEFLRKGVENGVRRGLTDLQPYTHEDLGGHTGPTPSPELYVRYLEYGCLSPITRVHCTRGQDRHPWAFGPEAQRIVTEYIKLRYRLLPMLYSAAQRATDDGTPILRRCDLEWPDAPEAARNDQYLLGDDLLVAPIVTGIEGELKPIPAAMLHAPDGQPGLQAEYFDNADLRGASKLTRTDAKIDFVWSGTQPAREIPQENFSARWTGTLGPVPVSGTYKIVTRNDDGVRVFVDGRRIIDDWKPEDSATNQASVSFVAGSKHSIRVEYMQLGGGALCTVGWILPEAKTDKLSRRSVWIPPGAWQNLWTGEATTGPQTITASADLYQTPMWVRRGGIVLTGPDLQYTGQKPMDPTTADVYLGVQGTTVREMVEDDGISTEYISGKVARTPITLDDGTVKCTVHLGATSGQYKGMLRRRNWIVRLHLPNGRAVDSMRVDGRNVKFTLAEYKRVEIPFNGGAAPSEGQVVEYKLPSTSVRQNHVVELSLRP